MLRLLGELLEVAELGAQYLKLGLGLGSALLLLRGGPWGLGVCLLVRLPARPAFLLVRLPIPLESALGAAPVSIGSHGEGLRGPVPLSSWAPLILKAVIQARSPPWVDNGLSQIDDDADDDDDNDNEEQQQRAPSWA